MYEHLFQQGMLGRTVVKNRIVMAPMSDALCNPDGSMSDQAIAYYSERAKGGAGIIIPAMVCVEYPRGRSSINQLRMDEPRFKKDFSKLVDQVHRYGALVIPQLQHCGQQTTLQNTMGVTPVAVSDVDPEHIILKGYRRMGKGKVMTVEEIKELVQKFVTAAKNCMDIGSDGVEIHGAHGYLINQFLSADTNQRTDEYGGSLENRTRFAVEVVQGIRKVCGRDFIIGARIPGFELVSKGLSPEDIIYVAKALEKAGCNYLHVTGGCTTIMGRFMEPQGYEQGWRVKYAAAIKKEVGIPIVTVGVLREPEVCEKVLAEGSADFVALGRTLICDPYWPTKVKAGRTEELRKCVSCFDGCLGEQGMGRTLSCALNPAAGREQEFARIPKAEQSRRVVVIGGGPAGMEAAIVAAQAGHRVTLLEKSNRLGGQIRLACVPPKKEVLNWAMEYMIGELRRQKVEVCLDCEATLEKVQSLAPDQVFVATGSVPAFPPIPGIEHGVPAWEILGGTAKVPNNQKVAIIGGGLVGCETALYLCERGCKASIYEMLPGVAMGLGMMGREDLMMDFAKYKVEVNTDTAICEIRPDGLLIQQDDQEKFCKADAIVLATGQRPFGRELYEELTKAGMEVRMIGDVLKPAKILNAVHAGFWAANSIL